jgi:hypothetical protein
MAEWWRPQQIGTTPVRDAKVRDMTHFDRCSIHESGHAVAALFYSLPLFEVVIRTDGSGVTKYARR